ncbi:scavenger receptor class B member 1 isoform X2 [Ambystoma mexicanum]|uniref:scavenger receptor class B member 1 isoform X2 n=1 Tax=Ambystoma mexicanum TaxID=8296 RepID=UPI0037E9006F
MSRTRCRGSVALVVLGLLLLAFGIVLLLLVPTIIHQQVEKNVQINPASGFAFEMWRDLPIPFYMSFYIFEVLNPQEILAGEKPNITQRGPYVYRENKQKTNISFHDNYTVSFLEYRDFHFVPEMSAGSEEDYLVVPNILVLSVSIMMEHLPLPIRWILSGAFVTFNEEPFMNRTVRDIMWGYDDPLLDFLNTIVPGLIPFKGKFGLFADFNNSNTGLFTVFTGVDDIRRVQMMDSWNGLTEVTYWQSEQCNMLNGTAGQMWPPFMKPHTDLEFYSPDACRSMTLAYQGSSDFRGIPTFRFTAPETLFANGTVYPPNEGFCPCVASGVQNVSACRFNAPVFMSLPHFYMADPVFGQSVNGLEPSESEHSMFIDLHPLTGIPMNVSIKFQVNLYVKAVHGISQTGKINPVILPFLWFEERGFIEGEVFDTYYTTLVLIPIILEYLQYIFIGLGVLLVVIALGLFITNKRESPDTQEEATSNGLPGNSETSLLHPGSTSPDDRTLNTS